MRVDLVSSKWLAALPLGLFVLFVLGFILSTSKLTRCGEKRMAGCKEIAGASIANLIELDKTDVMQGLYAKPDAIKDSAKARVAATVPTSNHKAAMMRIERRYIWAFFTGLSGVFSILSLLLAVGIADRFSKRPAVSSAVVVLPTLVLAAVLTAFPMEHMGVVHPLLEATIASKDAVLGMPRLPGLMSFLNGVSSAVALAMAISLWFLVRVPETTDAELKDSDVVKQRMADVRRRNVFLQIFLFVATAALVTGVLRMNATVHWIQAFLPPGHQAGLDGLRTTMVSTIGGFYSILLAIMYIPTAAILKVHADRLTNGAPADTLGVAATREEFEFQWSKVLARVVAILGPLLAGPIGEFIKNLATG